MSQKDVPLFRNPWVLPGLVLSVSAALFFTLSSSSTTSGAFGPGPVPLAFESSTAHSLAAQAGLTPDSFSEVARKVAPSVVNVSTKVVVEPRPRGERGEVPDPLRRFFGDEFFERFFGPGVPQTRRSLGSGVIVDGAGHLLTAFHVVAPVERRGVRQLADRIEIRLHDGETFPARVIGTDPESDLAVLKIDTDRSLTPPEIGDSADLRVGQWVVAVGSPFGLEQTVTAGIVSATGRLVPTGIFGDYIQTDAAINPGNSGGPLLDLQGRLVGINTFIATTTGSFAGVGFAVPSSVFVDSYNQLISEGRITRGWLGVGLNPVPMTPEMVDFFGEDGALVAQLIDKEGEPSEEGPAARAGIQPGDVIVNFGRQTIETNWDLRSAAAKTDPGTTVPVTLVRRGETMTVEVEMGTRTLEERRRAEAEGLSLDEEEEEPRQIGIEFRSLTEREARQLDLEDDRGVVVLSVAAGSLAEDAGLSGNQIITHVNGEPVGSAREFRDKVEGVPAGEGVVLRVISIGPDRQRASFFTSFVKP